MYSCHSYICRLLGLVKQTLQMFSSKLGPAKLACLTAARIGIRVDLPSTPVQVERLVAKLEQLRSDAAMAEERAASVSEEAKELAQALEERRNQLDQCAQNLVMARNKVDKLAQVS